MQISDRNYFGKYAIDPTMELDFEELNNTDLLSDISLDDLKNLIDAGNVFNMTDSILDDDILFEI